MKYNPPPGGTADAPYIDGNRSAGVQGSVVPAAAVEFDQRELVNLISFAGITPSNSDLEQVRKAVQALIAAATGGGDVSDYVLMSQARARLPIYPEILTADGRINVTSPGAGSILVPATVACQHRGIHLFNTSDYLEADRTFATSANKTYHLRWTPEAGFALKDVANATYNPGGLLAEGAAAFDSTYDDMLVARVVTSAGNVATITNLANRERLASLIDTVGTIVANDNADSTLFRFAGTFNWSRTPLVLHSVTRSGRVNGGRPDDDLEMNPVIGQTEVASRYGFQVDWLNDYAEQMNIRTMARAI